MSTARWAIRTKWSWRGGEPSRRRLPSGERRHAVEPESGCCSGQEPSPKTAEEANLVLFGTAGTNQKIAQLDSQLPVALNPGAANYGLAFIYPAGNRYVLVNSGLPYWQGADHCVRTISRPGSCPGMFTCCCPPEITFCSAGLWKTSSPPGALTEEWKLSPEDAARLRATGAVTVR